MKHTFQWILVVCLLVVGNSQMMAQLTSLGVIEDSLLAEEHYKMLFSGNSLYAASSRGLYQYDLNASVSEWEKLAFSDSTILDFEVRGDTIIALSKYQLYISNDGGNTANAISIDAIDSAWDKIYAINTLRGLAVHPSNAKRMHVSQVSSGLSYTEDGGATWTVVDSLYFPPYLCYNPLDEKRLVGYGSSYISVSRDGGFQWETRAIGSLVHDIAFHPTNKWRIVACGIGLYAMSDDGGYEWRMIGTTNPIPSGGIIPAAYLDDMVYDPRDPNILYGADKKDPYDSQIPILRSTDGGFTWETFYVIETSKASGVFNICMKDNLLAIYTFWDSQVYLLDVDAVDTSVPAIEKDVLDTPYYDLQGRPVTNPTRGIYIKDGRKIAVD